MKSNVNVYRHKDSDEIAKTMPITSFRKSTQMMHERGIIIKFFFAPQGHVMFRDKWGAHHKA